MISIVALEIIEIMYTDTHTNTHIFVVGRSAYRADNALMPVLKK
jgi:hypothetical protein